MPVAIVTGATSGLGLELSALLSSRGFRVVGVSRRDPDHSTWQRLRRDAGALHVSGDVSVADTAVRAFELAGSAGEVTLVCNCASTGVFGPAGEYAPADIDEALRGLIGTIAFSDRAFREFRHRGGTIVNVISTAAQTARANETVYCASKWGARGYTEALRAEAKATPVRVIAVYPGGMKTSFWDSARGASVDSTKFMAPADVAALVLDVIDGRGVSYVSDISVNRL